MTRNRFAKLAPNDRVEIFQFGRHPGVVVEIAPEVTIQGRTFRDQCWLKVRLDDGREWNGHFDLVDFRAGRPLKSRAA